jgi:hypothetical protein
MTKLRLDFDIVTKDSFLGILENIQALTANVTYCPVDEFFESGLLKYVIHFLTPPLRLHLDYLKPACW